MTTKHTGGPAFPLQSIGPEFDPGHSGMSLRDWFAGLAMQAVLTRGAPVDAVTMGKDAYTYADAMLKAREEV